MTASPASIKLLHISDLHFGRIEKAVLDQLEKYLSSQEHPFHLAILTGDLTQRARREQFIAAKEFLAKLKCPLFVVPGNHDVPLYNLFLRVFRPYHKFRTHFGSHAPQFYEDERVVVFGLWTVNTLKVQEGTIQMSQVKALEEKFKSVPAGKIKIVAFHHPLVGMKNPRIQQALQRVRELHPQVLMWGHDHVSGARHWDEKNGTGPVLVAAGTSVSNRTREESNSFNVLEFDGDRLSVKTVSFDPKLQRFAENRRLQFEMSKTLT
jgi:3',5'-cyclic AMP phosphodiesterase CpdA